VAAIQLFGGAINLNPHQHVIGLDGVYSKSADGQHVAFTPTRAPSQQELREVVEQVRRRTAFHRDAHRP